MRGFRDAGFTRDAKEKFPVPEPETELTRFWKRIEVKTNENRQPTASEKIKSFWETLEKSSTA